MLTAPKRDGAFGKRKLGYERRRLPRQVSHAYDYAKCTRCGEKNEVRAERCSRCSCELSQP